MVVKKLSELVNEESSEEEEELVEEELDFGRLPDTPEEIIQREDGTKYIAGGRDEEIGLRSVLEQTTPDPARANQPPLQRGVHTGVDALNLVARQVGSGLNWVRTSEEFKVWDSQPPPAGEYSIQPLNVTPVTYQGVIRHHLLVTSQAGKLTGFSIEENYYDQPLSVGIVTDQMLDLSLLLSNRKARTLVVKANHNFTIKLNASTNAGIPIYAIEGPFIIDLGLNIEYLFITTTQPTEIKLTFW